MAAFLDQSLRSHLRLLPIACFIAYLWTRGTDPLAPALWLTATFLLTVWRWRFAQAYILGGTKDEQTCRIFKALLTSGILYAVPTASFGVLGDFGRYALTMVLTVVATVSITTTSGYRGIFRAFAWPLLGSAAGAWIWAGWAEDSLVALFLGLSLILYISFLEGVARHANAVFMEGCAYRFGEQQLNAELKAALAEADEANRTKTQFLAAASHDLRQPMHSMSVLVAALSLRPLDEQSKEIVNLLASVNQMLSRQLDTLLDMSKLDAGIVKAHFETVLLDRIVKDHHAAIEPVAKNAGLRVDVLVDAPAWVHTDVTLLNRALSNLTDNAIKYTPPGGVVLLAVRTLPGQVLLDVQDSGIGIPQDEQERVFREFYQVGNVERDRRKGLGLGLSIVRRLCDLLRIGLSLTSQPGAGTTVTLRFEPCRPGPSPGVAVASPRVRQGLRILVVDDEITVLAGMRLLLTGLGCTVYLAEGVDDARRKACATVIDLVLSDLRLRGGESGVQAIEAVRALHPGVAAALITGDTAPERLRDIEATGLRLLFKPVSLEQLIAVIPNLPCHAEHGLDTDVSASPAATRRSGP